MATTDWLAAWPGIRVGEPLGRHSQYGIGGPADWFIRLSDLSGLPELLGRCHHGGVPVTVIGAGSNSLILDGGIRGLVIRLSDRRLRVIEGDVVELSAGYMMPRAAFDCAARGLAGMEFGIGIPGSCGASVYGNAGAFGSEIREMMIDCDALAPDGETRRFATSELGFGYRDSQFKHDLAGHVVTAARFRVRRDMPAVVRARTDAIQAQRKASQPYGIRSLGSMFKNPPDDHAGRLIEAAGLKGHRIGGAESSAKHAQPVVDVDHASAVDVLALAELARHTVRQRFGVDLEPEIIVLGEAGVP
jgi:UDP-N-acetylmuramate dehydrogenase